MTVERRYRSEIGYTLVELMIVLMVLAVLVAIGLPMFLGTRTRA